ncbi:hypothetical protein EV356DRAFT_223980 [Viridothelium virens]|uniref:Uncharacterized protein n=1 Tax=Viridothelium virens TaxID=1048519 RepID=A0A6A6HLA7_VIRVR|nr:hypothetical protein EV356DRAFT_223980 [Viridothelium virens]
MLIEDRHRLITSIAGNFALLCKVPQLALTYIPGSTSRQVEPCSPGIRTPLKAPLRSSWSS